MTIDKSRRYHVKRRRYFVKRAFQVKYTAIILFFIFLTAIISSVAVYLAIFPLLFEELTSVYPQGRLVAVLKDANTRLFSLAALLLPVAVWLGIVLSHRVAGPWNRLEDILRGIAEGKLIEVKVRKGDELQSLADAVNEVTKSLRSIGQENLEYVQSLEKVLQDLQRELNQEPIDLMKVKLLLSKIHETSSDIKNLAVRYSGTE